MFRRFVRVHVRNTGEYFVFKLQSMSSRFKRTTSGSHKRSHQGSRQSRSNSVTESVSSNDTLPPMDNLANTNAMTAAYPAASPTTMHNTMQRAQQEHTARVQGQANLLPLRAPTAGEENIPLPLAMDNETLMASALSLVGEDIVYTARQRRPGAMWNTYAAQLFEKEGKFFVTVSDRFNNCAPGVVNMQTEETYPFPADGWDYGIIVKLSIFIRNSLSVAQQKLNSALQKISDLERQQNIRSLHLAQSQRAHEVQQRRLSADNDEEDVNENLRENNYVDHLENEIMTLRQLVLKGKNDDEEDDATTTPDTHTTKNWQFIQSEEEILSLISRIQLENSSGEISHVAKDSLNCLRLALTAAIKISPPWSEIPEYKILLQQLLANVRLNLSVKNFATAEKIRESYAIAPKDNLSKLISKFNNKKSDSRARSDPQSKNRFCTFCKLKGHSADFCFKNPDSKNFRGGGDKKKL